MSFASLLPQRLRGEEHFRWRGGDVSRLESLSDAVFAIAMTLLVVTLQVPSTSTEVVALFWQFPAFAICFAFLIWIWHCHYLFHRRFGFEDPLTVALNAVLLFCVVFYVYPLKFLANQLITAPLSGNSPVDVDASAPGVMTLYACGFIGIFLALVLMHARAWRLRDQIQLDARERVQTRGALRGHLCSLLIGCASLALIFLLPSQPAWSGFVFFLMGPAQAWTGWRTGVEMRRALAEIPVP